MRVDLLGWVFRLAALIAFALPVAMFIVFTDMSLPSLKSSGFSFLFSDRWLPSRESFGALSAACGTLISSSIAIAIATPLSFGLSVYVTELASPFFAKLSRLVIDMMAGIPSIIFGMWALFTLSPFVLNYIQLPLYNASQDFSWLRFLFLGEPNGLGFFTSGLVLAFMVIPYMTSVLIDLFKTVPKMTRESAYGLGMTHYEYFRFIILPSTYSGALGALVLGLGRALGETMAVTFVIGHSTYLSYALFGSGTTISASIANEFNEALTDIHVSALIELGLILFFMSFVVITLGKFLVYSLDRRRGC